MMKKIASYKNYAMIKKSNDYGDEQSDEQIGEEHAYEMQNLNMANDLAKRILDGSPGLAAPYDEDSMSKISDEILKSDLPLSLIMNIIRGMDGAYDDILPEDDETDLDIPF